MLAFGGEGFELVGESALEAEEVDTLDIGDDILRVGGIATIYISERGVLGSAGECRGVQDVSIVMALLCTPLHSFVLLIFRDAEAVGGDGVDDGESVDGAALALEDSVEAFREVHLYEFQWVADMIAGEFEGGLDDLLRALGGDDGDGLGATTEVHGGEESREAEEVVAVEVRDEDGAEGLKLDMAATDIVLRALGAIEEHFESADIDNLGAATTVARGKGGAGTKYSDKEIQGELRIKNYVFCAKCFATGF